MDREFVLYALAAFSGGIITLIMTGPLGLAIFALFVSIVTHIYNWRTIRRMK